MKLCLVFTLHLRIDNEELASSEFIMQPCSGLWPSNMLTSHWSTHWRQPAVIGPPLFQPPFPTHTKTLLHILLLNLTLKLITVQLYAILSAHIAHTLLNAFVEVSFLLCLCIARQTCLTTFVQSWVCSSIYPIQISWMREWDSKTKHSNRGSMW